MLIKFCYHLNGFRTDALFWSVFQFGVWKSSVPVARLHRNHPSITAIDSVFYTQFWVGFFFLHGSIIRHAQLYSLEGTEPLSIPYKKSLPYSPSRLKLKENRAVTWGTVFILKLYNGVTVWLLPMCFQDVLRIYSE